MANAATVIHRCGHREDVELPRRARTHAAIIAAETERQCPECRDAQFRHDNPELFTREALARARDEAEAQGDWDADSDQQW